MQTLQHYSIQIRKNSKRCHNNSNTKNFDAIWQTAKFQIFHKNFKQKKIVLISNLNTFSKLFLKIYLSGHTLNKLN